MMKYLFLAVVLISNNPGEIAKINKMKKEAERAYLNGEYELALAKYSFLTDSMRVEDPEVLLNRAHCYYHLNDSSSAKSNYRAVAANGPSDLKSIAYQQLGVMAKRPQTLEESLQFMKAAVKENPSNIDARYDYEVVRKLMEQQKEQEQQQNQENQENQQQDDQDQQEQENEDQQQSEDQEGEENEEEQEQESQESEQEQEGEQQEQEQEGQESEEEQQQQQQESIREKLEEMNISEEKARMILEAMRNNEIQYLQQQRRKATERPDSGKPDW